jgi:CRISPR-associated endoribonuclease Cas6
MNAFLALSLTLRPEATAHLPMFSGVAVREWFFTAAQAYDPALAAQLRNGDGPRPFSLSPLIDPLAPYRRPALTPERSLECRLVALSEGVGAFLRTLSSLDSISMGETVFQVESAQMTETTEQMLLQQHMLTAGRPRRISMEFRSPVAFRSHGLENPFPQPDLVFGSLLDRWNSTCSLQLHPDLRQFARECIRVSRFRLHTMRLQFGETGYEPTLGAVGTVTYAITNPDPYWGRAVWALAGFGAWVGVGLRTAVGMGQMRLLTQPIDTTSEAT